MEDKESKDFRKEFPKCPVCGGKPLFHETALALKARGLVDEKWEMALDSRQGAIMQPGKESSLPIGTEVPGYSFNTDICMECGNIWAVKLERVTVKKTITLASPTVMPNREARRHMKQKGNYQSDLRNLLLS